MRWLMSNWVGNHGAMPMVIALVSLLSAGPATAEKRIALVVGNSAYQNITPLDNPRNDATLMAETLSGLALQLLFLKASESMGDHDSEVVGACSVD
jgi:hypothetical protein